MNIKTSYFAYECTQNGELINGTQKWPQGCETRPIQPIVIFGLSLQSFRTTTFMINHFGSTQESFYS